MGLNYIIIILKKNLSNEIIKSNKNVMNEIIKKTF